MLALAAAVGGCGEEVPQQTLAASVELDLPDSLPVGSPLDLGYTWTPGDGFEPPPDDYKVFVHIVDPDGRIVLQDDHYPSVPTSQWRAGEPVSYRRWFYPAADLRLDYFDFYVGLYEYGGEQIATLKDATFQQRPLVHTTIIRNEDQDGLPVFVEGWNERESALSAPEGLQQWQWMRKKGTAAFGNPRGDAVLHLRAHSPIDELGGAQTITVRIEDTVVARLEITESVPFLERIEVHGSAVGGADWVEVTLEVGEAFIPAQLDSQADDTRELGLQVFFLYLEQKS